MRLKKHLFIALVFPILSTAASAQNINPKLDSVLQKALNDKQISLNVKGLGAAIQFSNGHIWAGSAGISQQNPTVDIDSTQVFGIGSITKTVTAACILQLVDEGVLNLDDSLHEWLDTIQFINPNITIRQLLRHQSGIYDFVPAPTFQNVLSVHPDSIWQLADVVKTFIQAPLFAAGTAFSYSSTNFILLGMIIEKATGHPYYEEYRSRFFDPLGLPSMVMQPFEFFQNDVAHVWIDLNGDGTVDDAYQLLTYWPSFDSATGPAGSLYATPTDLARWMRAFLSGSLHSAATLSQAKVTVSTPFPNSTRYGLGIMERKFLTYTGYGHGGDSGYSGSAWYFPAKDMSIAVSNNDGSKNSWALGPVVQALLKAYVDYEAVSAVPEVENPLSMAVFPNPFDSVCSVSMDLKMAVEHLRLVLTNTLGEKVAERDLERVAAGAQFFELPAGKDLPAGAYFLNYWVDGKMGAGIPVMKS